VLVEAVTTRGLLSLTRRPAQFGGGSAMKCPRCRQENQPGEVLSGVRDSAHPQPARASGRVLEFGRHTVVLFCIGGTS
jgi:hypothetical protein